jgi:hypothetical protein
MDFIERILGISPDGGSGMVELSVLLVLFVGAAILAARLMRFRLMRFQPFRPRHRAPMLRSPRCRPSGPPQMRMRFRMRFQPFREQSGGNPLRLRVHQAARGCWVALTRVGSLLLRLKASFIYSLEQQAGRFFSSEQRNSTPLPEFSLGSRL